VATGRRGADWVEIVSGVKAGEKVVVDPGNLRTGQPVSVAAPSATQTSRADPESGP
jgi:multidrug efflux pump subunit AcrA (membrane-fusion protein)